MVPEGWDTAPLSSLLERIIDYRGQSVPKANTGIQLITARNVRKGFLDFSSSEYVDEKSFDNWMTRGIPKAGDILFTTEAPLGNACRFPKDSVYAVGQRTVTLRCNDLLDSEFLLYSILSEKGQRLIDIRSSGSTAKGIKSSELKKVKLTYPIFLPEQRKIAKILQTWDRAIATTEKLIDASKQQKKALMQQLLTGKKRFAGFEGEWVEFSLAVLCKKPISYGIVQTGENTSHGIPCIRVVDLTKRVLCTENMVRTSQEIHNSYKKTILEQGELMMALRGEIGLVRLVDKTLEGINITRGVARLSPNEELVDSEYLLWAMRSESSRKGLLAKAGGSALQEIALASLRKLRISVPTLPEQHKIAESLTASENQLDLLETKLTHLKQEKKALMQQLLTGKRRVKLDA